MQMRLRELDVPVTQLVPHEVIDRVRGIAEPELVERRIDITGDGLEP